MKRIICVGNRLAADDLAGSRVYDRLAQQPVPSDVEVIDGGLGGLGLLRFVDGSQRVVFVDAVTGFGLPGEVVVLGALEAAQAAPNGYDHAAGLAYLLRVLPNVCEQAIPEVFVVGLEGRVDEEAIATAAEMALEICTADDSNCRNMGRISKSESRNPKQI
jgi:hydrogenase maturation protease